MKENTNNCSHCHLGDSFLADPQQSRKYKELNPRDHPFQWLSWAFVVAVKLFTPHRPKEVGAQRESPKNVVALS